MNMFPAVLVVLAAGVATAVVSAAPWQVAQLRGTGVVSGRVVDGITGQPVRGAAVVLSMMMEESIVVPMRDSPGISPSPGFANYGKGIETGADGTFEFTAVPRGGFEIRAARLGALTYEPPSSASPEGRRWFELGDGERRAGLEISLTGPAILSGRVVNQRGSPLANIFIVAAPFGASPDSSADVATADLTDDRGRFLIAVPPGDYVVATRQFPEVASGPGPASAYARQFYPGADSIGQAARVRAVRGSDQSVDFVLKAVPTFRVSGTITGAPAPESQRVATVLLNPLDPRGDLIAYSSSSTSFSFSGVPPGQYLVRAVAAPNMAVASHGVMPLRELPPEPTLWAREPITVTDRDVTLKLELASGPRINGRVEFDASRPPPPLESMSTLIIDRADGTRTDYRGVYLPDGRFSTIQLEPARYVVLAWPPPKDWRLKSVVSGGRDIRDVPLEVGTADVNDVVITFTDRRTAVAGRVIREGPFEFVRGWITIFPFDRALWSDYGSVSRRMAFVEPGHAGTFEAEVPPGNYLIAATPGSTRGRITVETLTALTAIAVPVVVGDGQVARQDVKIQAWRR